jgi:hypothetical protein
VLSHFFNIYEETIDAIEISKSKRLSVSKGGIGIKTSRLRERFVESEINSNSLFYLAPFTGDLCRVRRRPKLECDWIGVGKE